MRRCGTFPLVEDVEYECEMSSVSMSWDVGGFRKLETAFYMFPPGRFPPHEVVDLFHILTRIAGEHPSNTVNNLRSSMPRTNKGDKGVDR